MAPMTRLHWQQKSGGGAPETRASQPLCKEYEPLSPQATCSGTAERSVISHTSTGLPGSPVRRQRSTLPSAGHLEQGELLSAYGRLCMLEASRCKSQRLHAGRQIGHAASPDEEHGSGRNAPRSSQEPGGEPLALGACSEACS